MTQTPITPELIRAALAHIPATLQRDDWARVGMAIQSEFPDDTGLGLFTDWSATAEGFNVGDVRSLVIHPASTTHFRMSDEALVQAGITQGTIRLSIGLEDADDLIDDLKRALKAAEKAGA